MQGPTSRSFEVLRFSILDECNFSCVYCVEDVRRSAPDFVPARILLSYVEKLLTQLKLKTIRITGGEPTLHPELLEIISGLRTMGVADIRMTTNGHTLSRVIDRAVQNGLGSVNISLDAVSKNAFATMSRVRDGEGVISGIDSSIALGIPVKLNCVVMRGLNDAEIVPLTQFARERGIIIRFLEVMNMGPLYGKSHSFLMPESEIVQRISETEGYAERLIRDANSTTNYYRTRKGQIFGVIANYSDPFCGDCNRLRLDSKGNVYGCLSSASRENLAGADLNGLLDRALARKQNHFLGSETSMKAIGG
ncbi:MAG: radical SAM protein [Leptospirales bacterium]|nr:radical SAM protein [Leptospirales bacterium]